MVRRLLFDDPGNQLTGSGVQQAYNHRHGDHKHQNNDAVVNQLTARRPGDLLQFREHLPEAARDTPGQALKKLAHLRHEAHESLFLDLIFGGHAIHILNSAQVEPLLAGFLVARMLIAEAAILGHLQTIGIVLLVLHGIVVALLALAAGQRDLYAHVSHLLHRSYGAYPVERNMLIQFIIFRHICQQSWGFNSAPKPIVHAKIR